MVESGRVERKSHDAAIASGLMLAVILWGANNTGVKVLVQSWPPIATGSTRFLAAGLLMLALFRWTTWFGGQTPLTAETKKVSSGLGPDSVWRFTSWLLIGRSS